MWDQISWKFIYKALFVNVYYRNLAKGVLSPTKRSSKCQAQKILFSFIEALIM